MTLERLQKPSKWSQQVTRLMQSKQYVTAYPLPVTLVDQSDITEIDMLLILTFFDLNQSI